MPVAVGDEDVAGLDVAVDEPARVRGVQREADLADHPHAVSGSSRPVRSSMVPRSWPWTQRIVM